jgi:nucleotide-binding universal stress UspA family protein
MFKKQLNLQERYMTQHIKKILFASDLSINMGKVFEHAIGLSGYHSADIVVLHVMEESIGSESRVKIAFGEKLYKDLKSRHRNRAKNILIGKNVDALRIRKAIAGFFESQDPNSLELPEDQPIKKILVAEGRSVADEIAATVEEEGCDLIVMGCKQKGFIEKAMGDKVINKLLKQSSVPVFIVPFSK